MDGRDLTFDGAGKCAGGAWSATAGVRHVQAPVNASEFMTHDTRFMIWLCKAKCWAGEIVSILRRSTFTSLFRCFKDYDLQEKLITTNQFKKVCRTYWSG